MGRLQIRIGTAAHCTYGLLITDMRQQLQVVMPYCLLYMKRTLQSLPEITSGIISAVDITFIFQKQQ